MRWNKVFNCRSRIQWESNIEIRKVSTIRNVNDQIQIPLFKDICILSSTDSSKLSSIHSLCFNFSRKALQPSITTNRTIRIQFFNRNFLCRIVTDSIFVVSKSPPIEMAILIIFKSSIKIFCRIDRNLIQIFKC